MINEIFVRLNSSLLFSKKFNRPLLLFTAPLFLLFYVLESIIPNIFSDENVSLFFIILLTFAYNGVFYTLLIYIIDSLHNNKKLLPAELKSFVLENFSQIAAAIVLISIFSIAGLFLFIIPGIILYARLAVAPYLMCLKQSGFRNSLYTSFEYSKRYTWLIFFSSLLISIPEILLALDQFFTQQSPTLIFTIVSYLTSIVQSVLIYHFYLDVKAHINASFKENA